MPEYESSRAIRMLTSRKIIPVDVAAEAVGNWKEAYQWIPILSGIAAFSLAFSAGANNLPTSFSLPVGSGSLTFLKAAVAASMVYIPGTALASSSSVSRLFSDFLSENQPNEGFLMWSMVVVLVTATLWLAIATYFELPVSSQQSTQGAILGTVLVTKGFGFIPLWNQNGYHNFHGGGLLWIFLEWTVAPIIACAAAFLFFKILKVALFSHENAEKRILIFLPIYYGVAAGLLCFFIMYQVIPKFMVVNMWTIIIAVTLATLIGALSSSFVVVPFARTRTDSMPLFKSINKTKSVDQEGIENQDQASDAKVEDDGKFEEMLRDFMQMRVLDTVYEEEERSWDSAAGNIADIEHTRSNPPLMIGSTPLRQLLESTPNRLVKPRNFERHEKTTARERVFNTVFYSVKSILFPVIQYDRPTLIRHALAEKFDDMEDLFGFPLLLSSCIFALIQSANEIAPLMSPFRAILDVFKQRQKYSGNGEDVGSLGVQWWIRAIGGVGASSGFFLCGWRLTQCIGNRLTYISNSRGVASQLSTVATIITLSRVKLPVSSVHAFIGALVGVGLADQPRVLGFSMITEALFLGLLQNLNWKLLLKFLGGWITTIIFCSAVAYVLYSASIHTPAYVVP